MLNYDLGKEELKNWLVEETKFSGKTLGKTETIMAQGNGYLGIRGTAEEDYLGQKRNMFISGTFNRFSEKEVTELPNLPDVLGIAIEIDGYRFSLEQGEVLKYSKVLNLKTAVLTRDITWKTPNGKVIELHFERFVSAKQRHVLGSKVVLCSQDPATVRICSGINGQLTNTGVQHFNEENMRFFDKTYLQMNVSTTQSNIFVSINTTHKLSQTADMTMNIDRRRMEQCFIFDLNGKASFEKLSVLYTSIDRELEGKDPKGIGEFAYQDMISIARRGYKALRQESINVWEKKIWEQYRVSIRSDNDYDELSVRFAIYHMVCMTPIHDNRMGVAAKGLTGEGYKGHSFWDTEIFILPFYIYSNSEVARNLLEYRFLGLEGAQKKALENNFKGAMYPWEAAWPSDGEVTPVWGGVDIVTGERTKIWSGFIEIHITSDICYMLWRYYQSTGNQEFMDHCGYEIIFDTATFWTSRYEWNETKNRYEINDVIGPDEYKEHCNNNAFTNYMSAFNLQIAIECAKNLKQSRPELYNRLQRKLDVDNALPVWEEKLSKIYLPRPTAEGIVPQDDDYLLLPVIDLEKYKNQEEVGTLFFEYNLAQVNKLQVSKQADVMMLFYLLEEKFSPEVKIASYKYYEPKTLHDSSLSLSTYSILANDLGDYEKAYRLFQLASEIDLGPNMKTSDHGIHAASLGGLWQCMVMGFGGMRVKGGMLHCNPRLPEKWHELKFPFEWHGNRLTVTVSKEQLLIESNTDKPVHLVVWGEKHIFTRYLQLPLRRKEIK